MQWWTYGLPSLAAMCRAEVPCALVARTSARLDGGREGKREGGKEGGREGDTEERKYMYMKSREEMESVGEKEVKFEMVVRNRGKERDGGRDSWKDDKRGGRKNRQRWR